MYKVLIVDDEPKQREGLRMFIEWELYGFSVVDTASNGEEALEKYQIHSPELVIADIRMPGMDGLQLIQRLREEDPQLHILILSGYADFEYAKIAIANRTDGYLLKPVDEDELIQYLHSIRQVMDEAKKASKWQDVSKEWTREAFIQSILSGAMDHDEFTLHEQANRLDLLWKKYQVLLVVSAQNEKNDTNELNILRRKLNTRFEECGRGYVFSHHGYVGVLLKEPLLEVEYDDVYQELQGSDGAEITIVLGDRVQELRDIPHSYTSALELIKLQFFFDRGRLLSGELLSKIRSHAAEAATGSQEKSSDSVEEHLYYAMESGNFDAVKQWIAEFGHTLIRLHLSEAEIKQRFVELLTLIYGRELKQRPELQNQCKGYCDQVADIYRVRTIGEMFKQAESLLQSIALSSGEDTGKHREVRIMLDLIHRNFRDNLKLETLSGVFNYNSAYLGKLFKNETGEYFNTYLDKVRIENAKGYLEEGLKVYQVAEKVGYTNVDYFHAKFRKYVGTSPSAYRKKAGNE
ncbi:MAG TPA: response regulator transcription factor [Paenibacillus sp.]